MTSKANPEELVATWTLPYEARLGSSVRSKGLYMQVRSHLPKSTQKSLTVKAGELTLRMSKQAAAEFAAASAIVSNALIGIETRPVIPREIEDILGITSTERRRWLEDGRLPSAGTRTIKLRGRGTITFHVFDPVFVAGAQSSDQVVEWREQDAEAAAKRRLNASWMAKKKRHQRANDAEGGPDDPERDDEEHPGLTGWDEFAKTGLP